ncbi:MAG: cytochrome c peroxidase [Acetobacteraceae bacterium]
MRWRLLLSAAVALGFGLAGARATGPMSRAEQFHRVRLMTDIGRLAFRDPTLSGSGRLSCASCHSPAHRFGPPNARAVQLGGDDLRQPGFRAVPSLTYMQASPPFTEHYFDSDDEGDESIDNGPTGGLTWDGRVDRGADQARIPLLSPFEMANAGSARIAAKARRAAYAPMLREAFGADVFDDPNRTFDAVAKTLEVYEQDAAEFYPYSSKYDAVLAGRAILTKQEARGLALFDDPAKGNCAQCHLSARAADGTPPQFTDYGFIALGVPRNRAIPANADPSWFDLGLCGPLRTDFKGRDAYCGLFMTPSLRNVATRRVFFHNGLYHDLRHVLDFYAARDSDPKRFYPHDADGHVRAYDDLPAQYRANLNTDPPFGRRDRPALSGHEIDDIIAFLGTLTDGYDVRKGTPRP